MRIILLAISIIISTILSGQELSSATVVETQSAVLINIGLLTLGSDVRAENDVELIRITYTTTGVNGDPDIASGLILVPRVDNAVPLHCHLHGTSTRDRVPSTKGGGYELGLIYASLGQMVVMPDYLGMGISEGFHPYVHRVTEASASVDMLLAAREYADNRDDITLTEELIIAGYSQGGHAAMALQQEIEENHSSQFDLVASTPMSGPYNLSGAFKEFILSEEEYFFPGYLLYQLIGYNGIDGSLYSNLSDILKEPYVSAAESFAATGENLGSLQNELIDLLSINEGGSFPIRMIKDEFVNEFIADDNHILNVVLRENDTHNFTASAPTRLIFCKADDQVPYKNSLIADSIMNSSGAVNVSSIDVLSTADHGGCVVPAVEESIRFINQFLQSTPTVDLNKSLNLLKTYPNPAISIISITNDHDDVSVKGIRVYNSSASLVYQGLSEGTLDISAWESGIYAMEIVTSKGTVWKRIIKQ